jgi:hypothetical protein
MWLVVGSVTGCITLAVGGVFTYMLTAHNTVAHGSCTRSVFSCEWIPTSVAALWQSYPFQSPRQEEIGRDIIAVTPDYVGCARSDGVLATRVSFMPKEVGEIGGIGLHSVDRSKPFVDLSAKSAITVVARGERGHETFGIDVLTSESGHYRARVQNSTALRVNEWTTIVVPFSAFVGDDDGRPLETDKRRAVRNLAVGWGGGDAAEDLCIDRLSVD